MVEGIASGLAKKSNRVAGSPGTSVLEFRDTVRSKRSAISRRTCTSIVREPEEILSPAPVHRVQRDPIGQKYCAADRVEPGFGQASTSRSAVAHSRAVNMWQRRLIHGCWRQPRNARDTCRICRPPTLASRSAGSINTPADGEHLDHAQGKLRCLVAAGAALSPIEIRAIRYEALLARNLAWEIFYNWPDPFRPIPIRFVEFAAILFLVRCNEGAADPCWPSGTGTADVS